MKQELTHKEIKILGDLYLEGKLTRQEEIMLSLLLEKTDSLLPSERKLRKLMSTEKNIFGKIKRRRFAISQISGIAAALLAVFAIAIPLYVIHAPVNDDFVVWQEGEKITGPKAKELAEEKQERDMEMIRNVMRQQREMMKRNFASVNMDDYDL